MMPSPQYNPMASESHSAVDIFISSVIGLIRRHATNSVLLLLKLDALQSVIREVATVDIATCASRLGCVQQEPHKVVEICVRVKLAHMLLPRLRERNLFLDNNILEMIEEWKNSDIETVRQFGWEYE